MPPLSMWLRISSPGRRNVRLWLPLFLVWLLLLPIVILAFAITIVVDFGLFITGQRYRHYTLLLLRCLGLIADTRGLVVRVRGESSIVDVAIQ